MKQLARFYRSLFFNTGMYLALGGAVLLFIAAYFIPVLLQVAVLAVLAFLMLLLLDFLQLYLPARAISAVRHMADRFSNGDQNEVSLTIRNNYRFTAQITITDELPFQFQQRDFLLKGILHSGEEKTFTYQLRPVERGEYGFGDTHVFVSGIFGLVKRRFTFHHPVTVKVYPSFVQLRQYELMSFKHHLDGIGVHRKRVIGHSMEFDHIREYVRGDDVRTLNWKATARRGNLMVNNFMEERSQQVYCVIDKGRNMKMPFDGMTLLDYAINSALVFCNVALQKGDKAGLATFTGKETAILPASSKRAQLSKLLEQLYHQDTQWTESDYESLGVHLRTSLSQRSLLILYTNFESASAMQRQLPYLRQLAKYHLLLVVFFENTELKKLNERKAAEVEDIYIQVIAQKFAHEKKQIVRELAHHGIMSLLTTPEQLTVDVVNKYLELKSRLLA
ncbi:DUF58 domain-containing protein [Chitinophaga sp. XS-30]|uniref:DUF58 domain-containing protein n=1 Tax=Chitinophaga sp. XS-30 TaxID=2604421 RepID=UPI0011DD9D21|nr:DUF58 domain-containing protein [Chitinophaga sp. XS-30]QEH43935.1 DUF58 domain-containing protein [Chitinophaga sp. XS-30]